MDASLSNGVGTFLNSSFVMIVVDTGVDVGVVADAGLFKFPFPLFTVVDRVLRVAVEVEVEVNPGGLISFVIMFFIQPDHVMPRINRSDFFIMYSLRIRKSLQCDNCSP